MLWPNWQGIFHWHLTTIGPPKSGIVPSIDQGWRSGKGEFRFRNNDLPDGTDSLGADAACVIQCSSRRMSYTRDDAGVTTRLSPKLLDQVRGRLRLHHYSLRTEQAYVGWIRRFILANGKRHPGQMGKRRGRGVSHRIGDAGPGVGRHCCSCIARFWAWSCPGWRIWCAPSGRGASRGALGRGSRALADDAGGVLPADGGAAVWQRDAAAGMPAPANQGYGHGTRRDCGARRQRGQGSAGAAAAQRAWGTDAAARAGAAAARR